MLDFNITDIKSSIDSPAVRRKIEDDDRRGKNNNADDAYSALNPSNSSSSSSANDNAGFIKNQKLQTREMIDMQDKNLDQLGNAVDRLGEIGRTINTEIKEQDVLLDALGNEIDDASSKMNTVQGALEKLLQTKDGCQIWTIVILAFILILLGETLLCIYLFVADLNALFSVALIIWT
jgi:chromosome segregation ATPase